MEFEKQKRPGVIINMKKVLVFSRAGGEMEKREYCKITLNSSSFTEIESDARKLGSTSLSTFKCWLKTLG